MVKHCFTTQQLESLMDQKQNLRTVCVIQAQDDKNKSPSSSVIDLLVQKAGIRMVSSSLSSSSSSSAATANNKEDWEINAVKPVAGDESLSLSSRRMDIPDKHSQAFSMLYWQDNKQQATADTITNTNSSYLIHLVSSPSLEVVPTALRLTDAALMVLDDPISHGVDPRMETVLRQAHSEWVKPCLIIDNIDRALFFAPGEELYQALSRILDSVNAVANTYNTNNNNNNNQSQSLLPEEASYSKMCPRKGTVLFGSCKHEWAFSIRSFATMYSAKFGISQDKMMEKLWGDWYFDPSSKCWTTKNRNQDGTPLERAFCQFVVEPLATLGHAILAKQLAKVKKLLQSIPIELNAQDEQKLDRKPLLERVLQAWLPAEEAIIDMMVHHTPSPVQAQQYRVEQLYTGPMDDATAMAIRACDAQTSAPLCLYISKMIPTTSHHGGQYYAVGRVFSGRITTGQKVVVMDPTLHVWGKHQRVKNIIVQQVAVISGSCAEPIDCVPVGNICAIAGLDPYLLHSGTIASNEDACCIREMRFAVAPVVRCAIEPKEAADLPKLVEAMKLLAKSDPTICCVTEDSGDHFIAASGESRLQNCLRNLQDDFLMGTEMNVSDPFVSFRETCTSKSVETCLVKSANKFVRLFGEAEELGSHLCKAIDEGRISPNVDSNKTAHTLADAYGWDMMDARRIWAFGPDGIGPNMFVDTTKGVNYLLEVKESVVCGFQWATQSGPLCEEPMRGCRFNFINLMFGCGMSSTHRNRGQVMPAARKLCFASMMMADPVLLEPINLCSISVPINFMNHVYGVVTRRRGHVFAQRRDGPFGMALLAYVPVLESFGFAADLASSSGGKAWAHCSFDHWEPMSGSPFDAGTQTNETVLNIRKRKGLDDAVPDMRKYLDKL